VKRLFLKKQIFVDESTPSDTYPIFQVSSSHRLVQISFNFKQEKISQSFKKLIGQNILVLEEEMREIINPN
jgi:hypothetical protein